MVQKDLKDSKNFIDQIKNQTIAGKIPNVK